MIPFAPIFVAGIIVGVAIMIILDVINKGSK